MRFVQALLLVPVVACRSGTPPVAEPSKEVFPPAVAEEPPAAPPTEPKPSQTDSPDEPSPCVDECLRSRMAESVAWEMIERQCAMQCANEGSEPAPPVP